MAYTALLDANVLHPMVLCDLLIRLSQHGLYRARWSRRILDEVVRSIVRRRPDLSPSKLERRIDMMNLAVADAEVEESEELTASLSRFGDDAHVVAAAVLGWADVIVTSNLADFPSSALQPYNLIAIARRLPHRPVGSSSRCHIDGSSRTGRGSYSSSDVGVRCCRASAANDTAVRGSRFFGPERRGSALSVTKERSEQRG